MQPTALGPTATPFDLWWTQYGRITVLAGLIAAYMFLPARRPLVFKVGGVLVAWWAYKQARSKGWF